MLGCTPEEVVAAEKVTDSRVSPQDATAEVAAASQALQPEEEADAQNSLGVAVARFAAAPPESAARFAREGMLRVNGVVSPVTCARLRLQLDGQLDEARTVQGGFVPAERRWDVFLPVDASVLDILAEAIGKLRPLLDQIFAPDAALCELSALITDGGSPRQGLHYDTGMEDGAPLLMTCFVALQDISEDMGGTVMLPRTAHAAAHQQLAQVDEEQLGDMRGAAATVGTLNDLPVVRCAISAGDVVCMDSRLLHCGGANTSASSRRRLFYFTICDGGGKALPRGASYSMFPQFQGRLKLNEMDWWEAAQDDSVQAADSLCCTPPR